MKECKHEVFDCFCAVGRLTDGDNGPVTSYCLDVKVQCRECKQFFEFVGLEAGLSPSKPTTSLDFTELRVPIRPYTGQIANSAKFVLKEENNISPIN